MTTRQACDTWQDWIWRGETYKCAWNVPKCRYDWGKSKTTGWQWSVGLNVKIPIPGAKDLVSVTPSYGRNGSTTTSFTFSIELNPEQKAQPIQVVERRWTKGVFQGIYHSTGKSCLPSPGRPDGNAYLYRWDPNKRWGSWTTNLAVSNYASYHVW
ncbi:hypothetical protein [Streptomyces sp. NPDC007991]|uniref:hypothetical protein n=1 Tax=Streptomyces sp. NPDC007991 TaxID=3364803 RepID=UPI0036E13E84